MYEGNKGGRIRNLVGWPVHPPKLCLGRPLPSLLGTLGSHDRTINNYGRGGRNGNSGREEDFCCHGGR